MAQAENEYYTIFKAGGNLCTPITLKTPYGTFQLVTELTIPHSLSWFEAYDCEGNQILSPTGSVSMGTGKPTIRTYVFTTLFPHVGSNSQSQTNESDYQTPTYSSSNSEWAANAGRALADLTDAKGWNNEYHLINLEAGYGFTYGNAGIRLRYTSPVVFGLSVAFGYNTKFKSERADDKRYLWNVGMQMHLSKFLALSLYAGPQYFSKHQKTEIGFGGFLEYTHQIYKRLGASGGIGFVMAAEEPANKGQGMFAFHIGLSYNLFCR